MKTPSEYCLSEIRELLTLMRMYPGMNCYADIAQCDIHSLEKFITIANNFLHNVNVPLPEKIKPAPKEKEQRVIFTL